jgi:hypothetical protein
VFHINQSSSSVSYAIYNSINITFTPVDELISDKILTCKDKGSGYFYAKNIINTNIVDDILKSLESYDINESNIYIENYIEDVNKSKDSTSSQKSNLSLEKNDTSEYTILVKEVLNEMISLTKINNNILIDDCDSITHLGIKAKKLIKNNFSNDILIIFEKIFKRILEVNKINNTEDMHEFYKIQKVYLYV